MQVIVIDDDPTGSQTVNNCLLLLKWNYSTLIKGFQRIRVKKCTLGGCIFEKKKNFLHVTKEY